MHHENVQGNTNGVLEAGGCYVSDAWEWLNLRLT